jgi:hypothetical protein
MMKAANASETSANFYQTTQRNNLQDSHLETLTRLAKNSGVTVPSFQMYCHIVVALFPGPRL